MKDLEVNGENRAEAYIEMEVLERLGRVRKVDTVLSKWSSGGWYEWRRKLLAPCKRRIARHMFEVISFCCVSLYVFI